MNFNTTQRVISVVAVLLSALYLFQIGGEHGTGDVVKAVLIGLVGAGLVYGYHRFIETGSTGALVSTLLAVFASAIGFTKLFLDLGSILAMASIGTLVSAIAIFGVLYLVCLMVENAVVWYKERKTLKAERESYGLPAEPVTPPAGATAVEEPTR